jgi:hypothetical protein
MKLAGTQRRMTRIAHVTFLLAAAWVFALAGQEIRTQEQTAPPPLKIITRQERSQLDESKDPKSRMKITLEFAETHLTSAENNTLQHEYDHAAAEAGMYWALVENALTFMKTLERDSNRKRDLYKRLELALRAHGPRLTLMRRSTPAEYSVWIKEIEDFARKGRTEALNSFYGNTVVRDNPQKPRDIKEGSKP